MTTPSRCELCFLPFLITKMVLFHRFRHFTVPKSLEDDVCCKHFAFERGRNVFEPFRAVITNFLFNHDMRVEAHCSAVTFM